MDNSLISFARRVLVVDKGTTVEFDKPLALLSDSHSLFGSMVRTSCQPDLASPLRSECQTVCRIRQSNVLGSITKLYKLIRLIETCSCRFYEL